MNEAQRKRSRLVVLVLVIGLLVAPATGRAGTMTGGATEWTQIANNITLVMGYARQVMDYVMQIKHLTELTRQNALFSDPQNVLSMASMFTQLIGGVNQLVFSGRSLAAQWKATHPGAQEPGAAGYPSIDEAYKAIDKDLNRAAEDSLKALDIYVDPQSVQAERAILQGLQSKMQSADGQARIAQVANELLFEVVRQLSVIRQVLLIQARMTAEDVSAESQQRLYKREQKARDYQYRGRYRAGGLWP